MLDLLFSGLGESGGSGSSKGILESIRAKPNKYLVGCAIAAVVGIALAAIAFYYAHETWKLGEQFAKQYGVPNPIAEHKALFLGDAVQARARDIVGKFGCLLVGGCAGIAMITGALSTAAYAIHHKSKQETVTTPVN